MAFCQDKCFVSLIVEALTLKKQYKLYVTEKELSKAGVGSVQKCLCSQVCESCKSSHHKSSALKKNSFIESYLTEDTVQNFILKSVLGFLGGILLTYTCFMFMVFSLNFTLKRATIICIGLGMVLSLGLAFSVKIRCTVFLCIPQLFSKRGRQALLAYAFILALSGPAKNTLHNVEVMSESLACGQEQIKQTENELLKCVQKPNAAAKKSIEKLLDKINKAVKYFKNFVLQLYRTCFDVCRSRASKNIKIDCESEIKKHHFFNDVHLLLPKGKFIQIYVLFVSYQIRSLFSLPYFKRDFNLPLLLPRSPNGFALLTSAILICRNKTDALALKNIIMADETLLHAQNWLYSISVLCNKKMGDPSLRCQHLLFESTKNCEASSSLYYWKKLCQISPVAVKEICPNCGKAICHPQDIQQHLSIGHLKKRLKTFKRRILNILYVEVDGHQTYTQSNRSNTFHEEYQGMATEIRQKTDQFLQYFDFMSVIFGVFILVLFVKVIIYRHKFLTEDHYDNRFITPDFEDIDNTRAQFQMETILPLNPREKTKYIKVTSIRLVPCEKVRLFSSFIFLIFATFKIIIHMMTDSSLYWILSSIRRDERLLYMTNLREKEPCVEVKILGKGLVADLFRNVTDAVQRQYNAPLIDPTPCLPDPVSPDWNRYYQIPLVLICWLLALFEPYGLRLRHTVMVIYHPDRARERAIWLYNRIISHRNSFVKIARREIRKKYKNGAAEPMFRFKLIYKKKVMKCLLCQVKVSNEESFKKCETAECLGTFCCDCYSSLKYCSICTDPAEYGDRSDLSEEKDSSEDEKPCKCSKSKKMKTKESKNITERLSGLLMTRGKVCDEKTLKSQKSSQSLLFQKAVKYCRKKLSKLNNYRNLSDLESSDWDSDFSLNSKEPNEKLSDHKQDRRQNKTNEEKKVQEIEKQKTTKAKSSEPKKYKKDGKIEKRKTSKVNLIKMESRDKTSQMTVRLFRKIQSSSSNALILKKPSQLSKVSNMIAKNEETIRKTPQPNFLFKNYKKVLHDEAENRTAFLNVKDSVELAKIRKNSEINENVIFGSEEREVNMKTKKDVSRLETSSTSGDQMQSSMNLGPVIKTKITNKRKQDSKIPTTPSPSKESVRAVVSPKESNVLSSETMSKFPPKSSSGSAQSLAYSSRTYTKEAIVAPGSSKFRSPEFNKPDSKDELKSNLNLRKVSAKLNLAGFLPTKHANCRVETDSSDDEFLSVKTSYQAKRNFINLPRTFHSPPREKHKSSRKLTAKMKGKKAEKEKLCKLSLAPDLLSDLPSSKQDGSGSSTDKD